MPVRIFCPGERYDRLAYFEKLKIVRADLCDKGGGVPVSGFLVYVVRKKLSQVQSAMMSFFTKSSPPTPGRSPWGQDARKLTGRWQ
jgi:hypothetical protein